MKFMKKCDERLITKRKKKQNLKIKQILRNKINLKKEKRKKKYHFQKLLKKKRKNQNKKT